MGPCVNVYEGVILMKMAKRFEETVGLPSYYEAFYFFVKPLKFQI
jgi:hypothetical protein